MKTGEARAPVIEHGFERTLGEMRPPLRSIAGADAIATAEQVVATLKQQIDAFRDLSSSLAVDEARRHS